ncbi:lipoate--protein ligase family protein [candidate division KSB1 bacterium]|nr:lipoate--protein ligase family protein [candidate division KSB1 bacterium]
MALDMAMTQVVAEGHVLPTLRVYRWRPWAISLGYHQAENEVDVDRCRLDNVDVVLRPTGGRAILHAEELTYAVSIPPGPAFSGDIQSVYSIISRCLVASLDLLGINVGFERARKTPKDFTRGELSSLCYASSVQYEINIGRRKLVGSAQRRIQGSVLQHGSILIGDAHLALVDYLAAKNGAWRERVKQYMIKNTISLNQVSPQVTYEALARALHDGFQRELGIEFVQTQNDDVELERARQLAPRFSILNNSSYGQ